MSKQANILIVEDEEIAASRLKKLIHDAYPGIICLAITDSIEMTVNWLNSCSIYPDLIFMDIELADGQSFEIFQSTSVKSPVIFTTAYDEFALRAFKVNSIDYLLKPIKPEELELALKKWENLSLPARNFEQQEQIKYVLETILSKQSSEKFKDRFLIKQGQKLIPVPVNEIAYFYTEEKVVFIKTKNEQRYLLDHTLDELEKTLNPEKFFRANRQFILCAESVSEIHTWFNGKLKVNVKPKFETELIISREKAADFKSWIGE